VTSSSDPVDLEDLPPSASEVRELRDPRTLRAITHPVRLALLEVLALDGPLTATQAGELIGESPTTCSFHFRQLAKYGFVEEAGPGPGRQRPWRLRHLGMSFSDVSEDPELSVAARSLERMVFDRALDRLHHFHDVKSSFPVEWQVASESGENVLFVTPDELSGVLHDVVAVLDRFRDRIENPETRPEGSLPVEVLVFAYPIRTPGGRP